METQNDKGKDYQIHLRYADDDLWIYETKGKDKTLELVNCLSLSPDDKIEVYLVMSKTEKTPTNCLTHFCTLIATRYPGMVVPPNSIPE